MTEWSNDELRQRQESLIPVAPSRPQGKHLAGARFFQGIPGIEVVGSRLFAVCYAGGMGEGPDNFVVLYVSDDGGEHWTDAVAVVDPPGEHIRAFDAAVWRAPDTGVLYLFWAQGYALRVGNSYDGRAGVWFSCLENPLDAPSAFRWSAPRRIADGVMMNKPTVLRDGTWALPVSVWNFVRDDPYPAEPGTKVIVSEDCGRSFSERGRLLMPPEFASYDEHTFVELADGSLRLYARAKVGNAEAVSRDGGRTWAAPTRSAIPGPNARMHVGRLASGRLLLVNHDYTPPPSPPEYGPRSRMTAWLSEDDGATWKGGLLLDGRAEVSYPDACQAQDGTIYVVHDFNRYAGGWIVASRVTEADILAGRLVDSGSRLGLVVACGQPVPPEAL